MDDTHTYLSMLSFRDQCALRAQKEEWDFAREMSDLMDKSPAYEDYYGAVLEARRSAIANNLIAGFDEDFEEKYSVRQGIKAACLAKEDSETSKRINLRILERLDRIHAFQVGTIERLDFLVHGHKTIKRFAWICTTLLFYIAIRLS